MKRVYKQGKFEIWEVPAVVAEGYPPCSEFYVYGVYESGDPRVCPSLEMAMAYVH